MASIEAAIDGKKETYVSSSESEGEDETDHPGLAPLPHPVYDGMPQVDRFMCV